MVAGPLVLMLVHNRSDSAVSHEPVRPDLNSRYTEANLGRQRKFVVSCGVGRRGGSGPGGRVWADVSQKPPSCRLGSFNNSWVWHDMHIVDINYPDL